MSGRPALLVALALVGGCGDGRRPAAAPAEEVKGAPLRQEKPAELPPEAASLGDVDSGPPPAAAPSPAAASGAAAATAPPPIVEKPTVENAADYITATFDELSGFDYLLYAQDAKKVSEVPAKILALSGKKVAIDGYMMPLSYEAGGAKKFLLMKNQFGCCYAVTPKVNEWVEVTMQGGAVAEYIHLELVTVWGTLEVKPQSSAGQATGLYSMKATRTEFTEAK